MSETKEFKPGQNPHVLRSGTTVRQETDIYPEYTAEIKVIQDGGGITDELLRRIIKRHQPNSTYNRKLYKRYRGLDVPIYGRAPRFPEEEEGINNQINNDFFGEIVDIKTGYFAGMPIAYSYSATQEAADSTEFDKNGDGVLDASEKAQSTMRQDTDFAAAEAAGKLLTDFVVCNNMQDMDMQSTLFAACCGYVGRLLYIDTEGNERVMIVPPYETIILSETDIMEPFAAVRYYSQVDVTDNERWYAEYYDAKNIRFYEGSDIASLVYKKTRPHLFDYCPLQGIPNNTEMMGDPEKEIPAIDAYDRALSDANNEVESFANAYMVFENIHISDEEIAMGQKTGAFKYRSTGDKLGKIYFVTKDINDAFIEHHLDRLEQNIYRFSKTPNLNDENFSQNASGVAMKFKLTGLETKCGMFQAKMRGAGVYMFKCLASAWKKRNGIDIDPLQCMMDFHRNFPLDLLGEAQAVQALINAGVPKQVAYAQFSFVDDVDYLMQLIEEEKEGIPDLGEETEEDRMVKALEKYEAEKIPRVVVPEGEGDGS